MKIIFKFFDHLEDRVRGRLSHFPIPYAFIAGAGVIIFWRGVWHTMDFVVQWCWKPKTLALSAISDFPWWDGPLSTLIGMAILLLTGAFVSSFIGNEIIISGVRGEKKIAEKTEAEVEDEMSQLKVIRKDLRVLKKQAENEKNKLHKKLQK